MMLLDGRLAGAVALIWASDCHLSCAVQRLLRSSGCTIVTSPDRPVDLLVVPIGERVQPADTAREVFRLVEAVRDCGAATGSLPRRVIALVSTADGSRLALSLTRTVVIYLTAHTAKDDVRINIVHIADDTVGTMVDGAGVALALASGWLDGMRGQLLRVGRAS
jgi:hypothetical protein